ncbi:MULTISPECIES: hypothetical protein [Leptolyngbya]|uniref:hypothetical protein n=1 Tax=Leptolyngbya TaxID=47251 RepID=UPI00168608BF|nr:hypothetical protein [Leptolyngbya sp. FACHB-1624]MBD1858877.1 hypothetical protein [Leptolyngbya sp. FACHB-1624]
MAFSLSNSRSRSQESPMLWLSVLAGSLALHLVLLLVGRWYLSQPASGKAGGDSQAPLEFVEIDPNAPPLKGSAPSATATENATVPQASPEAATPEQAQTSIQSLNRPVTAQRSQPEASAKPEPVQPIRSDSRSTSRELSTNPTTPKDNSTSRPPTSSRNTNPGTTNPGTTNPGTTNPGTTNPGTTNPGTTNPGTTNPGTTNPGTTNPDDQSQPATSSTDLSGYGNGSFSGQMSELQVDPNAKQDDGALSVTFKTTKITQILPITVPNQVLDLRVAVIIDNQDGTVLDVKVLDSSPTLQTAPNLKDDAQTIAYNLLVNSGDLFNVVLKSTTNAPAATPRIITLQIDGKAIKTAP